MLTCICLEFHQSYYLTCSHLQLLHEEISTELSPEEIERRYIQARTRPVLPLAYEQDELHC